MTTQRPKPQQDSFESQSPISDALRAAESETAIFVKQAKRYLQKLQAAHKSLDCGKNKVSVVSSLVKELREFPSFTELSPPSKLADVLSSELEDLRRELKSTLSSDIRSEARAAGFDPRELPDGIGIGPFKVRPDTTSMVASIEYARVVLNPSIPLDARAIVSAVLALKKEVFDDIPEIERLASTFEQAMRVAWVRENRSLPNELRVNLPSLYREMEALRSRGKEQGSVPGRSYSLARFIVELKTLLTSPSSYEGAHPMRPEAAIIHNTQDNRKSVYLPKDLECGYGEGIFYQAIVQRQPDSPVGNLSKTGKR